MQPKIFGSKKATVTTAGAGIIPAVVLIVTFIMQAVGADPDLIEAVVTVLTWALTVLLGTYNIGQGIADRAK